jgi:hypothetical protein
LLPLEATDARWFLAIAALHLYLPLVLLAAVMGAWAAKSPPATAASRGIRRRLVASFRVWSWGGPSLALAVLVALTVRSPLVRGDKAWLQMDYYAQQRLWPEALESARGLPASNLLMRRRLMQALYFTNRLPYDRGLFSPDRDKAEPMPASLTAFYERSVPLALSQALFELGYLNEAEHLASEALEIRGPRPSILRHMVLIYQTKKMPEAAGVFLNALQKIPGQRSWVEDCRAAMNADPMMDADETVAHVRTLMPRTDSALFFGSENWDRISRDLLAANPRNRMALEYMMTYYLLLGAVDRVAENISRLKDFDYAEIPLPWEEALVIHQSAPDTPSVNLGGRSIRPETIARYKAFIAILAAHPNDGVAARNELKARYGDTYWFYYMFDRMSAGEPSATELTP